MSQTPNERVAYFNGDIMPESQVRLSFRDSGFKFGDAVFDLAPKANGKGETKSRMERSRRIEMRTMQDVRTKQNNPAKKMLAIFGL